MSTISKEIGNYNVLSNPIGHGGFANVYRGVHKYLGNSVAIKVIDLSGEDDKIRKKKKFLEEAHACARLEHPNIIRVSDYGSEGNIVYMVMSYASGGTLRDYMRANPSPRNALAFIKPIASALQYAHNAGYIHLDVKPENILVDKKNNNVLLSDFGAHVIAHSMDSQPTQSSPIGTPPYMAPEHLKGKPCRASDQYALATILYEWWCGRRPFDDNNNYRYQRCFNPPPNIKIYNKAVPEAVAEVIMKALHMDPRCRYTSVREFISAYEQAINQFGTVSSSTQTTTISDQVFFPNNVYITYTPPYQKELPKRHITMQAIISIVLVGIVIIGSTIAAYLLVGNKQANLGPNKPLSVTVVTHTSNQQRATNVTSQPISTDFTQGLSGIPHIQESMTGASPHDYPYSHQSVEAGECASGQDGYLVTANTGEGLGGITCIISGLHFNNVAVQVQVYLRIGSTFGLAEQWKTANTIDGVTTYDYYRFMVSTDGGLNVFKGIGSKGHTNLTCDVDHSNFVTGLLENNTNISVWIGMKTIGNYITGYINGKQVIRCNDGENPYTGGTIGFSSGPGSQAVYRNAQIYVLN